jgi:hypothetical protein
MLGSLAPLGGCVLSAEAEWAQGVEEYYRDAIEIAGRFQEGDDTIRDLADEMAAGGTLDDENYSIGYEANETMNKAYADWLNLTVGDPALRDPHLVIEEAMRDVRKADKDLMLAIDAGNMSMVSDANAQREAGDEKLEAALEEMQAWYAENERRIQRGLNNAE